MDLFLKVLSYTCGILIPIATLIIIFVLIVKYGFKAIINAIENGIKIFLKSIKFLFHFIIDEFKKAFFEFTTVFPMITISYHPPQGDIQYAFFILGCVSIIYLLLKKGNVSADDFSKITGNIGKIKN